MICRKLCRKLQILTHVSDLVLSVVLWILVLLAGEGKELSLHICDRASESEIWITDFGYELWHECFVAGRDTKRHIITFSSLLLCCCQYETIRKKVAHVIFFQGLMWNAKVQHFSRYVEWTSSHGVRDLYSFQIQAICNFESKVKLWRISDLICIPWTIYLSSQTRRHSWLTVLLVSTSGWTNFP